jgi:hypothetical protein
LAEGSGDVGEGELEGIEVGVGEETIGEEDADDVDNDRDKQIGGEFDKFLEGMFTGFKNEDDNAIKKSVNYGEKHCESYEGEEKLYHRRGR